MRCRDTPGGSFSSAASLAASVPAWPPLTKQMVFWNLLALAANEEAISIQPAFISHLKVPNVVMVPIADAGATWDLFIVWQRGKVSSPLRTLLSELNLKWVSITSAVCARYQRPTLVHRLLIALTEFDQQVDWLFFKARAKCRYLNHNGRASNAEKQPTGRGPEGCV